MAAKDGKFVGYIKPIITNLKVLGPQDRKDSFFNKIWESIVGTAAFILKNQKKDQLASKITLQGAFKNPKTNTIDAIWEVLRNAFIQALLPSIDNEININSVNKAPQTDKRTLLQRAFSSGKKKDTKKK